MITEIKFIDAHHDTQFESLSGSDLSDTTLYLTLLIGPANEEGGNYFSITVTTPQKITELLKIDDCFWGSHVLIIDNISTEIVKYHINNIIQKCESHDFGETARKLANYLDWEYSNYKL
jgi:hypothetical protein